MLLMTVISIITSERDFRSVDLEDGVEYLLGTSRLRPLSVLTISYLTRDFDRSMTLGVYSETKNMLDLVLVGL